MFINLKIKLWKSDNETVDMIINTTNINYIHEKSGAVSVGTKQFYLEPKEMELLLIVIKK